MKIGNCVIVLSICCALNTYGVQDQSLVNVENISSLKQLKSTITGDGLPKKFKLAPAVFGQFANEELRKNNMHVPSTLALYAMLEALPSSEYNTLSNDLVRVLSDLNKTSDDVSRIAVKLLIDTYIYEKNMLNNVEHIKKQNNVLIQQLKHSKKINISCCFVTTTLGLIMLAFVASTGIGVTEC